jgi:hypothetical protein
VDTAGKFRVAFFRKNRYYSVFICAKTGRKLYFPHKKEISFSAGISQICRACRVFPKVLVADRAGKILSKRLGSLLSAKLVKLTPVATDEHFRNGGAKKAVQDIDYMTTCLMADRGLPKECWDVVGEHASLLNACHYPCPSNPSITIYECETGEVKFLISMQFQRLAALQCVI